MHSYCHEITCWLSFFNDFTKNPGVSGITLTESSRASGKWAKEGYMQEYLPIELSSCNLSPQGDSKFVQITGVFEL